MQRLTFNTQFNKDLFHNNNKKYIKHVLFNILKLFASNTITLIVLKAMRVTG